MPSWSNLMGLSLRTKAKASNAVHGVKLAGLAPVRGASKLVGSAINLCSSGITNTTGIVSSSNAMGESMEAAMSRTSLSDWENLDPNCSTGSENSGTPTPDPIQGELPKASNTTITEPTTDREGASYETAASGGSAEREPSSVPFTYRNMFKPPVDDDGSESSDDEGEADEAPATFGTCGSRDDGPKNTLAAKEEPVIGEIGNRAAFDDAREDIEGESRFKGFRSGGTNWC